MDKEDAISTTALVGLQGQLDTVRSEIFSTNNNLQSISRLMKSDSDEDKKRLLDERDQERLLLEKKIRTDQEEVLEQKVSSTLVAPISKLEKKLSGTFNGITAAIGSLFGFFGFSLIEKIQSSATFTLKKFSGIGNFFKKTFDLITSGLSGLKNGFSSIISGIGSVTSKVIDALSELKSSPFKAISDLVKKLLPSSKESILSIENKASTVAAGAGVASSNFFKGPIGNIFKMGGIGLGAISTYENLKEGDAIGSILSGAATIPSPLSLPAALGSIGYETLTNGGIKSPSTMLDNIKNFDFNKINPFNKENNNLLNLNLSSTKNGLEENTKEINIQSTASSSSQMNDGSKTLNLPTQMASFSSLSSQQKINIGNLPTPTPDIILLSNSEKQQSTMISKLDPEIITDVPRILSGNPDNFYTLYSQVSYNVVI